MIYTKDRHFSVLAETTSVVMPVVDAMAYADIDNSLRTSLSPDMERVLNRRRHSPLLRPLLVRMCYELTGGLAWREQAAIMASIELFNISTYQSNYCFDEKAGVDSVSEKNNQFICSMLTLSKVISVVESYSATPSVMKSGIATLLARSNHEVYQGQFQDLNVLHLNRISNFSDLESFLPAYLARCDLIAGSTFRACAVGAMVNDPAPEILDTLFVYLGTLGAATQVINDLGDYIPHATKGYAAPFSDFQLGRLTLPTFLLQKAGLPIDEWRANLQAGKYVESVQTELVEAIKDLKVEPIVRRVVKERLFPLIKSCLSTLEATFGPDRSAPFRFAYPFIFDSRMLRYFRKDADRAWG